MNTEQTVNMHTIQRVMKTKQTLTQPQRTSLQLPLLLLLAMFLVAATASAKTTTWTPTTGGVWTTAGNWNNGTPVAGDVVIINSTQSASITAVPTITLSSLTVSGTCTLAGAASGNTITLTNAFGVSAGTTLTMGSATGTRLNLTLSSTATGTIDGTVAMDPGTGGTYTFTDDGALIMAPAGIINGAGGFTLASGATLQIGSTAGITSGTTASGNIQVTGTRTFDVGANYVYNGIAAQSTGTGLPTGLTGVLTINNPGNTVTLSAATTIASGGTVNIVAGTFAAGTSLTMSTTSSITRSGGTMTGTIQGTGGAGVYNVTYTGNSMTTSSELSGADLNNVTVNLTPGQTLTLAANVGPDGNLSVTSGIFNLSTFTFNRSASGGTFTLANGATLLLGANNFPTLYTTISLGATSTVNYDSAGVQSVTAQTYGNLIFSGSGAKTIVAATSVSGNLSIAPTGSATASLGTGLNLPVGSLTLGGLGRASGTWGSTSSSATYQNNTYFTGTGIVTVSTDTRSTPTIITGPTASPITYGQTLASSTFSGGSASVPGSFAFTSPTTAPSAGTASQSITFTPTDTTSYTTVLSSTSVTVNPAPLVITANNQSKDYGAA